MRSSDRLLELLEALGSGDGHTLTSLSQALTLPKPTVLRFLRSLEERDWVWRRPDSTYGLGSRFLVLAQQATMHDAVLACAAAYMLELRDRVDETVGLLSVAGRHRVCVLEFPSTQPLRYVHEPNATRPLHAGASGKVLLAFGPDALRAEILAQPLERYTESTITNVAGIEQELDAIRTTGWAMSHGERSSGSVAVAVPLWDPQSGRVSSLTIFAPQVRYRPAVRAGWVHALRECARAIEMAAEVPTEVEHSA